MGRTPLLWVLKQAIEAGIGSHSPQQMDTTIVLDPKDLDLLLRAEPGLLLGQIMRLNNEPRYRNRLDAIQLAAWIKEVKQGKRNAAGRKR